MSGIPASILAIFAFIVATVVFRKIWLAISRGASEEGAAIATKTFGNVVFYGLIMIILFLTVWLS